MRSTRTRRGRSRTLGFALLTLGVALVAPSCGVGTPFASSGRVPLPPGAIHQVMVVDLENESFDSTFGPTSPATYLNGTLVPMGELIENYYATGHVSLDNYIAQVSGQAPTPLTASDCVTQPDFVGRYLDVAPGTDDPSPQYAGQVDGDGCVFPKPTATSQGAPTIADQLDAKYSPDKQTHVAAWREYAQDMGNDPAATAAYPIRSAAPTAHIPTSAPSITPNAQPRSTSTRTGTTRSSTSTR